MTLARPSGRCRVRAGTCLGILLIAVAGCGVSHPHRSASSTSSGSGIIGSATNSSLAPAVSPSSWTTYDGSASRSGVDTSSPAVGTVTSAWSAVHTADVYAQPLVVGSSVIVADESDTVTAYDASNGAVEWSQNLGSPVPGSDLPCGDISPSGITGTPVADLAGGTVWVVAFLSGPPTPVASSPTTAAPAHPASSTSTAAQPPRPTTTAARSASSTTSSTTTTTLQPTGFSHELFSLDLSSGKILSEQPVDPSGADPDTEQQRGALALAGGYVYVPFGGLFGDCGTYHGYVVGVPLSSSEPQIQFQTDAANQAGIWYPAGPVLTSGGNLLVASGNGEAPGGGPSTTAQDANSVILLNTELQVLGTFTPSNTAQLSSSDLDLGSTDPLLLPNGDVFIAGKQGVGYVLSVADLSGGPLYSATVCSSGAQAIGGSIFYDGLIVVSCSNGLVGLTLSGQSFSVAWTAGTGLVGPPIASGGDIWFVDIASGSLEAVDPSDGKTVEVIAVGSAVHFESPAASGGRIFVFGGGKFQAFDE